MSRRPHRYTRRVVQSIALAQKEAERLDHEHVGPEHLLLALLHEESGGATKVLRSLDINVWHLQRLAGSSAMRGAPETLGKHELNSQARRVMELAEEEARRLGHAYIGTEHVLLGLLREGQSMAQMALRRVGISLEHARAQVQRLWASGPQFDNSLPDRETARSFRAQVAPRAGFPYQRADTPPTSPDTFSDAARGVLAAAHAAAQRAHQNAIGTEHLLLALLERRDGPPARVLVSLGGDLARLRAALEALAGHRAQPAPDALGLTPHARAVIERSVEEARRLRHARVLPAHLLLGLARDHDGVAVAALRRAGLDPARVHTRMVAALRERDHPERDA